MTVDNDLQGTVHYDERLRSQHGVGESCIVLSIGKHGERRLSVITKGDEML